MTIYNQTHPTKPVNQGLVEIIETSSEGYYTVAVDGVIMFNVDKHNSMSKAVSNKNFIKKICKTTGANKEDLVFVNIDWESHVLNLPQEENYDIYQNNGYQYFLDIINTTPIDKKNVVFYAKGVTSFENDGKTVQDQNIEQYNLQFIEACNNSDLEQIKYTLEQGADIDCYKSFALINAAQNNNIKVLQYLLTSPDIKQHASIISNGPLVTAYIYGSMDAIKYMTSSPELKFHYKFPKNILETIIKNDQLELLEHILDNHLTNHQGEEITLNMINPELYQKSAKILNYIHNHSKNKKNLK